MGTVIEDKQREGSLEGKIGGGKGREGMRERERE